MESTAKELPKIFEFRDVTHIPYFLAAILLVDVVTIFLTRYFPEKVGGESLNDWYDKFGLEGVIAHILIILIGFILAQVIYSTYVAPTYGWNPLLFIALLVGIQLVHDVVFYHGIIKQMPAGMNDMMDTYKKYAQENGGTILLGNAFMMIGSAAAALGLEVVQPYAAVAATVLGAYSLPYILNTKMQGDYHYKPVVKAQKKEEGTEETEEKQKPKVKAPISVPKRPSTPWDMLKPQVQSNTPDQVDTKNFMQGGMETSAFEGGSSYSPYSLL
jgi:hypothetical protein